MHHVAKDLPKHVLNPFKSVHLDDAFSRLNRIWLFTICLIFGILTTIKQYVAHEIKCHGFKKFSKDFAEDFCWTQGLYTIKEAYDMPASQVPYPGLVPETNICFDFTYANGTKFICPDDDAVLPLTRIYHTWYQWITFYFWVCAGVFYLPYIAYHTSDIGGIKPACVLLQAEIKDTDAKKQERVQKAANRIAKDIKVYLNAMGPWNFFFKRHKFFFIIFFNKLATFAILVLVIYATESMFQIGSFISYGFDMVSFDNREDTGHETNPKDKLFPKMIMCEIKRWGASGLEEEQGMCILAPNVVIQYLFLVLWVLLLVSFLVSVFSLFFSTTALFFTAGQYKLLLHQTVMLDTPIRKHVYYSSGISGRVTLDILSRNVKAEVFEQVYDVVCGLVVEEKQKEALGPAKETQSLDTSRNMVGPRGPATDTASMPRDAGPRGPMS